MLEFSSRGDEPKLSSTPLGATKGGSGRGRSSHTRGNDPVLDEHSAYLAVRASAQLS